jgi:hypothetical protein
MFCKVSAFNYAKCKSTEGVVTRNIVWCHMIRLGRMESWIASDINQKIHSYVPAIGRAQINYRITKS